MSETPELPEDRSLREIAEGYEKLINKTQEELQQFRKEQNLIKEQVLEILEENNTLGTKLDILNTTETVNTSTNPIHEQELLTKDAINNFKQQIQHLREENCTLQLLWKSSQKTIANLETEIKNYRNQLFKPNEIGAIKQKYSTTIKLLDNTIKCQKNELEKRENTIRDMVEHRKQTTEEIQTLRANIQEKDKHLTSISTSDAAFIKLKEQLNASVLSQKNLENSLQLAKLLIDEQTVREKNALQKVQEALSIADIAVADKEDAVRREQVIKEECDNLASTIGQVMEEAAKKVEKDVETLRKRYSDKERSMQMAQNEIVKQFENQKKQTQISEMRCNSFEQKLKEAMEENIKLNTNLELASRAIIEMKLKLEASENLLKEDKRSNRLCEKRENEIQQYICNNQQLKARWKSAIEEVTKNFQNEIARLQEKYLKLKAENQILQSTFYKMKD